MRSNLLKYFASFNLSITSPIKDNSVLSFIVTWFNSIPIVMTYPSLECKSIVLHILTLIPLSVWPSVVHPTTDSMLLLSLLSLHKPSHLIPLVLHLSNLSHDSILFSLATFQISFCWISVWKVECTLEDPLGLLDLVPFLFTVCSCLVFL